jgi:hypothetical protein
MVVGLAALPSLKTFTIEFQSAVPYPDQIRPRPRNILPALTFFQFRGASEYLENLVAQIDGPQLIEIVMVYSKQSVDSPVAQLCCLVDRSVSPRSILFRRAHITILDGRINFTLYGDANYPGWDRRPSKTTISWEAIDRQVSHMAQVLRQFSSALSNVVHLELEACLGKDHQSEYMDVEWLHLLHQASAVQTLNVSWSLAGHIALALQGITEETVAEVLPSLELIYLQHRPSSSVEKFVAVRQLSGRPVTVVKTTMEFDKRLESYIIK